MPVVSEPTGVEQLLLSAVRLVQEAIGTSGACCRRSFPYCQLIFHDSRHAAHDGSRKSHVFISSHRMNEKKVTNVWERCCVFLSQMYTRVRTEVLQSRLPASPVYRALHSPVAACVSSPRGMGLSRTWLAQAATSHHPIAHRREEVDYRL